MPTQSQYSDRQIADAIRKCRGNLSATARTLGLRRRKLKERVDRVPALVSVWREELEALLDRAEENIYASVYEGDHRASIFVLRTLGRDRGYCESTELRGDTEHPLVMAHELRFVGVVPENQRVQASDIAMRPSSVVAT
jgi:hypothetical protein